MATALMLLFALAGSSPVVEACRYSIRDVSFVDLEPEPYRFYWLGEGSGDRGGIESALSAASTAVLGDANLRFERGLPDNPGKVPDGHNLVMTAPDGRRLTMAVSSAPENKDQQGDWAVSLVQELVSSRLRQQILEAAIDNYAVVIVAEGEDADDNRRIMEAAREAVSEITRLIPRMPKPVDNGPVLLTISRGDIPDEKVAMWSMGMDLDTPDVQSVVVSGRGRRVGPPLTGGLANRTAIQEHLAVVGQDCECELDRSWMQGPMMPVSWDPSLRKKAFTSLGFDTENPMVKSEMSRIIARGPNADPARSYENFQPASGFDDLLMGYQEIDLSATDPAAAEAGAEGGGEMPVYRSGMTQMASAGSADSEAGSAVAAVENSVPADSDPSVTFDPESASPGADLGQAAREASRQMLQPVENTGDTLAEENTGKTAAFPVSLAVTGFLIILVLIAGGLILAGHRA